jgi:hypothetical protein
VVATDPRPRNGRSRQAGCVTHHHKIRIRTGRDAEIARTDAGVLVTASIFEMMLGPNETIGPDEHRVISGHSPIVLGAHHSVA